MLREAAQAGHIVWKDGDGQQASFVWTNSWLGKTVEPEREYHELVGRYLTSYGPVTASDLAGWLGVTVAAARRLMAKHLVEEVSVEGEEAPTFMKPEDLPTLVKTRNRHARGVAIVPPGDPLRLAYKRRYSVTENDSENLGLAFLDGRLVANWTLDREAISISYVDDEAKARVDREIQQLVNRAGVKAKIES